MADAYFLDASAAVKAYIEEPGSERVESLLEGSGEVYVSRVGPVEVSAAIFRKVSAEEMEAEEASIAVGQLRSDMEYIYQIMEVGAVVAERAMRAAERHRLRGYDCIQLACVLLLNEHRAGAGLDRSILVSADGDLNRAAAEEGVTVENPSG